MLDSKGSWSYLQWIDGEPVDHQDPDMTNDQSNKLTSLYLSIVPKNGMGLGPGTPNFLKWLRGQYP